MGNLCGKTDNGKKKEASGAASKPLIQTNALGAKKRPVCPCWTPLVPCDSASLCYIPDFNVLCTARTMAVTLPLVVRKG
eukprot:9468263-Pyramimonas_sp.AAC.1